MSTTPLRWIALMMFVINTSTVQAQKLIAHRGASADAPENTLAAFRLAFEQGADGIEGDFYLTRDGQIVCLHDADTGRTGDKKLKVATSTLAELRTVDVGAKTAARFKGERIPTLGEVLAVVPAGKVIFVEIKCGPEILPVLEQDFKASKLNAEQIAVIAFNPDVIEAARRQMPQIRGYGLSQFKRNTGGSQWQPGMARVIETLERTRAVGLGAGAPLDWFTKEHLQALRSAGYELHCWTIDDEQTARALQALGVDSIITNRPAALRKWLFPDKTAE